MADDSNKIVFVVDADTGQFSVKMNGVEQQIQSTSQKGVSGFEAMALGVIGLNQGLELATKVMQGLEAGMKAAAKFEGFHNQEIALRAVGAQAGLVAGDMKKLTDIIQLASRGTVDDNTAMLAATRLLEKHVSKELIPTFVEFATVMKATKGADFMEVINSSTKALEGSSKALELYNIRLNQGATPQQNAIDLAKQMKTNIAGTGDQILLSTAAAKTKTDDLWDSVVRAGGKIVSMFASMGSEQKTAGLQVDIFTKKLEELNDQQRKSPTKDVAFQIEYYTDKLHKAQEALSKLNNETRKDIDQKVAALPAFKETGFVLSEELQTKLKLAAQFKVQTELFEQGKITSKEYYAARKKDVDLDFENEMQKLSNKKTTIPAYNAEILDIERRHLSAVNDLKTQDFAFDQERRNVRLAAIQSGLVTEGNTLKMYGDQQVEQENKINAQKLEDIQHMQLNAEQLHAKLEAEEIRHQNQLTNIQRNSQLSTARQIGMGWQSAMNQLRTEWGNWGAFATKVGTQTHQNLSKSFIDMAKAHKFSMDVILNNFFSMIGETLIQKGVADLLMGIYPPNPVQLALGAAEIAAGSALVGATSAAAPSGADTGGGGGSAFATTGGPGPGPATQEELQKKTATIIVNGDFLNSRETANHLATILRENSDITDYTITAQGKQF